MCKRQAICSHQQLTLQPRRVARAARPSAHPKMVHPANQVRGRAHRSSSPMNAPRSQKEERNFQRRSNVNQAKKHQFVQHLMAQTVANRGSFVETSWLASLYVKIGFCSVFLFGVVLWPCHLGNHPLFPSQVPHHSQNPAKIMSLHCLPNP